MAHLNQQIGDEIAARLASVASVEGRVFRSRLRQIQQREMPCILVVYDGERIEHKQGRPAQRIQSRTSTWSIVCVAKASSGRETGDLESNLFNLAAEVEAALLTGPNGPIHDLQLVSEQLQFEDSAEMPMGYLAIGIEISAHTREGAPQDAL